MRKNMNIPGILCLAVLLLVGASACSAGGDGKQKDLSLEIRVQDLCQENMQGQFSMQAVEDDLYILYPERDTLALKLLMLSPDSRRCLQIKDASYLDRISHTTDVDALFGEHLYQADEVSHNIYFYDLQSETKKVLKHIQRAPEDDSWRIELIPADGRLIAVLNNRGAEELFVNPDNALVYFSAQSGPAATGIVLKEPFRPGEAAHILDGTAESGFTVYDTISRQLYRILLRGGSYSVLPLPAQGPIHYAAVNADNRLDILTYNPENSELLIFEEDLRGEYEGTAVTLCRGTTSVFFFSMNGRRMFLYNETTLDRRRHTLYCLSLLYPDNTGKYRKTVLYEDKYPIRRFQAVSREELLYIAFVQEPLRLLSVCFSGRESVENQDL
jgi:hypothetical protein